MGQRVNRHVPLLRKSLFHLKLERGRPCLTPYHYTAHTDQVEPCLLYSRPNETICSYCTTGQFKFPFIELFLLISWIEPVCSCCWRGPRSPQKCVPGPCDAPGSEGWPVDPSHEWYCWGMSLKLWVWTGMPEDKCTVCVHRTPYRCSYYSILYYSSAWDNGYFPLPVYADENTRQGWECGTGGLWVLADSCRATHLQRSAQASFAQVNVWII